MKRKLKLLVTVAVVTGLVATARSVGHRISW